MGREEVGNGAQQRQGHGLTRRELVAERHELAVRAFGSLVVQRRCCRRDGLPPYDDLDATARETLAHGDLGVRHDVGELAGCSRADLEKPVV